MTNNDNNPQKGTEQRPGQEQTTENVEQRPEQEQTRENAEQRTEQEQAPEQTGTRTGQEQKGDQAEQRPDQNRKTEKAFTPSPTTMKADEQPQAPKISEGGLTLPSVVAETRDIDNVN